MVLRVLFCVALRGKLKIAFSVPLAGDVRPPPIIRHMISSNTLNYSLLCHMFSHSNPLFPLAPFLLQILHLPLDIFGSLHAGSGELSSERETTFLPFPIGQPARTAVCNAHHTASGRKQTSIVIVFFVPSSSPPVIGHGGEWDGKLFGLVA